MRSGDGPAGQRRLLTSGHAPPGSLKCLPASCSAPRRGVFQQKFLDPSARRFKRRPGLPIGDEFAVRQQPVQLFRDGIGMRLVVARQNEAWERWSKADCLAMDPI